ncbi:MAG: type II toxin-antitoxin system VapC family toxin [Sterolibacterium sp.]|nr:type II toxin-antitoxin system VapC family toxin [Sterolibacterium sp.]
MKLLLDSHFAFWWQTGDARITAPVRQQVEAAEAVFVSQVSLWELSIKAGLGRLRIDLPVFARQVEEMGFSWLNIGNAHILKLAELPAFDDHKDPFDRLLVAQSLAEPLILLTADAKLARYGSTVKVV